MKATRLLWSRIFRGITGCIDEDGLGCDSVGWLGFRMVLYIGYLYIRLAQKCALTKCGLGDTPALYLTLIAV